MFARVSTYELDQGRASEAIDAFAPAIEQIRDLEGFVDGYFLVERDGAQGLSVTVWETFDAMDRGRIAATRARTEASRGAGATVTSTYEYEVGVHAGSTVAGRVAD